MKAGRPLRFLGAVLGGWIGLRVFVLWPDGEGPALPRLLRPAPAYAAALAPAPATDRVVEEPVARPKRAPLPVPFAPKPPLAVPSTLAAVVGVAPPPDDPPPPVAPPVQALVPAPLPERAAGPRRWSGSVFGIARPGGGGGGIGASQLGGSQAGARVAYALGDARRIAVVARVAAPFEGRGREAALGVEWRPFDAPVRLFAERRIALDGGRGGPSAGVVGGVYRALPAGFRLEGYGQAGVVDRGRTEAFADGAARAARPVARVGRATLDLGLGAWGAAQRGAARLDVGPTLGVAAPVAGRTVRLTLDYRARVGGDARPGSGPALSLGADF